VSNDLIAADLKNILANFSDNDYLPAYQAIVDKVEADVRSTKVVNRKARVERFKEAVSKLDRGQLAKANSLFKGYLRQVRDNAPLSENMDEPRLLTVKEAEGLMGEMLSIKEAKDILAAREEEVKRLAFSHLTEQFAADGEDFPELINGSIDVPSLGKRFSREGAGRKDPELQEKVLRSIVGEGVWAKVVDTETVVVEKLNIGKFMALAAKNPALLADLSRSLKVGEDKPGRLNVRDI
jgi:hypothetical protein